MAGKDERPIIIVKKKVYAAGHHGGSWKVAFADFATAMMAFFLLLWLVATMTEEQLGGISEYFRNPSIVEGRSVVMAPGAMGPGGAGDAPVRIFDAVTPPDPATTDGAVEGAAPMTEAQIEAEAREIEKRRLEQLKEELQQAIETSPALQAFKDQLLLDITPEGLRIQIVDQRNRPMFDIGSHRLQSYTISILNELAPYLQSVPNRISISGHTDVTPFAGDDTGYTNWELSADRANAARRALIGGGLGADRIARVVGLASTVLFDPADPTHPINRRISIIVMNKAAEEAAASMQTEVEAEAETEAAPPPDTGTRGDAADPPPAGGAQRPPGLPVGAGLPTLR
ncbi:flagellar motor protein MotB [Silanimonas sp.]|uniref:flagellar motor protein MotB n=1 Tax=Silanimonas sp. TaxID=1929290 RepID=UPI001BBD2212|nr:flagellar motor protein MotB [Silanimonas sp.]MBS3897140.1 flagellar motor protein MotB [Silanimonas sp.]